uniref:C-type lectin domain-containing protein n=1 Tax=Salmo trutta TaxID=8032 RepID=A0A673W491_SALTR
MCYPVTTVVSDVLSCHYSGFRFVILSLQWFQKCYPVTTVVSDLLSCQMCYAVSTVDISRCGPLFVQRWQANHTSGKNLHLHISCKHMESIVFLSSPNKTWEEALDHCRKHFTDLTSLLSENEQLLVQRMINSKGAQTDHLWTGLRFLASEWLWVNGDPLEYQAWTGGRLPHCPAQHLYCGTLAREGELWGTRGCEERRNFLCST